MFRSVLFMAIVIAVISVAASSFLSDRLKGTEKLAFAAHAPASMAVSHRQEGGEEFVIAPDRSGNFITDVEINGSFIRMVVDTGATYVSLTEKDAETLGFHPAPSDFRFKTMTANGTGVAAKVHIDRLGIGGMVINGVEAFVMPPGAMSMSLLGMSALRRIGSVEISGGELLLRQ